MRLNDWLTEHDVRPVTFARRLGVSPSNVYRYLEGTRRPAPETAARIGDITGGAVGFADLYASVARHPVKHTTAKSRGDRVRTKARGASK